VSLMLPYLVMSVLSHIVVCVRLLCFGVKDCLRIGFDPGPSSP